jgi:anaerobic selenocysteine-containing dehydrogenase
MKTEIERKPNIKEDVWINTQCRRCQAECGIRAHRVNGVVVQLEGNPDSTIGSRGGLCPKGLAGLQVLYDPNRLKVPMRRTNPVKGIGVDPKWKEISWDEALDEIAAKLKTAMDKDPSKIIVQHGIVGGNQIPPLFLAPMLTCCTLRYVKVAENGEKAFPLIPSLALQQRPLSKTIYRT